LEEEEEINLLLLLHPQWAVEGHIYMYSYIPIERDIVSSSSSSSSTSTAYRCAPLHIDVPLHCPALYR